MIIYFADRRMNILGQASTSLPEGLQILQDKKTEEVETGTATFECNIPYTKTTRKEVEYCTSVGNYLLRKNGDEAEFYTIIQREKDNKAEEVYIYAEDAGLDLLNETVGDYEADKDYPAAYYIEMFSYDSGFEIGLNEISDLSRRLKWENEATATERIASVAAQFEAEISYSFEVKDLTVVHKYINLHRKRGKSVDEELRLNRDVDRILTTESITNLATALRVTGGTLGESKDPISLNGYQYDDGDFYVSGVYLMSRSALQKWSRYLVENGDNVGHIVKDYSYDTTSQSELCRRAVSELKKLSEIEVNYEVDIARLPMNTKIGDNINIVDEEGELYLNARILKLETSVSEDTQTATLGEYLIQGSGVEQRLEELAEQFKDVAKNRSSYTWIAYADNRDGTGASLSPEGKKYIGIIANQSTSTVDLSDPSIFNWVQAKGEQGEPGPVGEAGKTTYFHVKYSPVENPTAEQLSDIPDVYIGTYSDFNTDDSENPEDYVWCRLQGVQGPRGDRGIPGMNGEDGNTSYLHIKYSNDGGLSFTDNGGETSGKWIGQYVDFYQPDSEDVTKYTWTKIEGDPGTAGIGIRNIANRYAVSDSSTTEPTTWYNVAQVMTATNKYLWSYEIIYYTDGTTSETDKRIIGVYGDKGNKGDKGEPGAAGKDGVEGRGISSIVEYYLVSSLNSGVTIATSGWSSSVKATSTTNKYLWNYEVITYTDGTKYTSTPVIIGTHGATGDKGDKGDTGSPGRDAAVISSTEPDDRTYLWCDISSEPAILKRWNGVDWSVVNDDAEQIIKIYSDIATAIEEASDNIMLQVGEKTYVKDEVDQMVSDVNTTLTQTKNAFNFEFSNFRKSLDSIINNTDEKFSNVEKYIRFIDGSIYIGIQGNPIMLCESNDRISFLENNVEVAYISNRTLYFTHAEVLKDLKIGRFAWVYMDSGYLPLKLVQ